MKVTVFHAADGDCLLVESDAPTRRLLVDGGRQASYAKNTRALLGQLRPAGETLDIVCVSHIDDDHITGILRLVEDEVEWRAFEFAHTLDANTPEPDVARPPEIGAVWHNGLFRLVGDDLGHVAEPVLATVATVLAGSRDPKLRELASDLDDLVTGERASMELTRRLSVDQLGIALNPPTVGQLMKRETTGPLTSAEVVTLGSLTIRVLGPSQDDIDKLRVKWQEWIDANQAALDKLQAAMLADEERLGTLSSRIVANPMLDQALGAGLNSVTEANLASLMLLVEEGARSALLTGDGVSREILDGLERHAKLDAHGRIHVNLLKVQHHGALANVDEDFVKRVTADHYVFCGNGAHHNPEIEVIEAFATARLAGLSGSGPLGPPSPFKFWFSSGPTTPDSTASKSRQKHMKKVKETVTALRQGHQNRLSASFLKDGHFEIDL
jgi:beta-lactamase superfamily II metal-dependent hydrolase